MLLGEFIRFWGVSIVGVETRVTKEGVGATNLITNGPFAYVRNPLYIGNIMIYTGVGIMSMALFPWLLIIEIFWFFIQYYLIVSREEEYLAEKFKENFKKYCEHVPRFIPRLTPYRESGSKVKIHNIIEGLISERRTVQAIILITTGILFIYFFSNKF